MEQANIGRAATGEIMGTSADARGLASPRMLNLLVAEGLASVAGTLMTVGFPFFSRHQFGWEARHNFLLTAAQGLVYVCGALAAQGVVARFGRRRSLVVLYALLTLITGGGALFFGQAVAVAAVLAHTVIIAVTWPMLESLVSDGADAHELSKLLGAYNVNWAATGAIAFAACGAVIQYLPPWSFFALTAACHGAGAVLLLLNRHAELGPAATGAAHHVEADPSEVAALVGQRRLALWLSRIALPATYVVIYSLAPLLPSLPGVRALSPTAQTLLTSAWLVARAATFAMTGLTVWWHTRPKLLFWCSVLMLGSFLGTVIPPALPVAGAHAVGVAVAMLVAQLALGLAIGLIYAASLYFGMVLSEGSTEHAGYHEALIGGGQVLGPAISAAAQWLRPGDPAAPIAAAGLVIALAVVGAGYARFRATRRPGDGATRPSP